MANLYPTKRNHDGFFDFLPSWFDEWGRNFMRTPGIQSFAADVAEKKDEYSVKVDLPGFSKDNIHLDFDQGVLTIEASRTRESNEKAEDGSFIRQERSSGSYARKFALDNVDDEKIKASFKDGVLTVILPKREVSGRKNKQISID
ncbi:Hsp20/alpha crystallin family protein [Sporolactobacillus sp. Y61]|uniref:Hsp20/alpha crystallin family protein n=1 Tax=Sporolactobacillus sp. Y61 TaxID=3160863 RepID=A0AAU8IEB9_9BACL|nr:Hsp20/alpha crystallin family protein [Sporolactobacillus sp. THM19-2]RYL93148.1 Hsp20/alpha crystallin family protein [Sporolactobacillus sp. THM19-2]